MVSQLTTEEQGLRLFFTDDIYLVDEIQQPELIQMQSIENKVVINLAEPVQTQTQTPQFKFLGSNKRNILILVNDVENDVSDEKGRELLRKIVKSVNLTANDFALLNYAQHRGAEFSQLMTHFSSVIVFAFGVSPQQLGLNHHPENTVVREGDVMLIFSAELRKLEEDPNSKKVLWGSLKQLGL